METLLPDIWFGLIGFILFLALALDGFDLGIGIISLVVRDEARRAIMMGSIGPVWHANLTWLVVTGGLFFGAFPLAYGVILTALYLPLLLMICGLIFRGVSFDFREEAAGKLSWSLAFGIGSLGAALGQGFVVGGFVSGFKMMGSQYAGGGWDWLNPWAALVALGLLSAYGLLGATYLVMKTEGRIQEDGYRYAQVAAWSLLVVATGVGLGAIFQYPFLARKWFAWPGLWLTSFPILLGGVAFVRLIYSLRRLKETAPFLWSVMVLLCASFAMAASIHPYVIPPEISLTTAAAPAGTLKVMLGVMAVVLPLMLIYNGYQYLVFRGKSKSGYAAD
jgi:cytochrome d ubiquinol oxidase subunit II